MESKRGVNIFLFHYELIRKLATIRREFLHLQVKNIPVLNFYMAINGVLRSQIIPQPFCFKTVIKLDWFSLNVISTA